MATPLTSKVTFNGLSSGWIAVTREALVGRLGKPHGYEDDPLCVPGPVSYWGFQLENAGVAILEFHEIKDAATLYTDQDARVVLLELGLEEFEFTKTVVW